VRAVAIIGVLALLVPAAFAAAPLPQDVVTVGSGLAAPGGTIDVPVFIRDVSGTPVGIDQPPGSRIQSYSLKVGYAPTAAVQSITFTRAGITQSLTPAFEASPAAAGSITLLDTFQEATNLIPFVSNAPAPGNQVAHLLVTLAPSATPGTVITLTLDPLLTQLSDQAGTAATKETVPAGNLALVNGAITVTNAVPALSTWMLALLATALSVVALRLR
jgi:hypothetical protein